MYDTMDDAASAEALERFPPFRYMGIKVLQLTGTWGQVRLLLPLSNANKNPGGGMFGGSMAALADPVPAMAANRKFPGNNVWTREMSIDFRRPGLSDLELRFDFPDAKMAQIAQDMRRIGRSSPLFEFGLYDADNQLVAWVYNRVAIRP
jgi:uncharacterized protein (TIGR00369 family)